MVRLIVEIPGLNVGEVPLLAAYVKGAVRFVLLEQLPEEIAMPNAMELTVGVLE